MQVIVNLAAVGEKERSSVEHLLGCTGIQGTPTIYYDLLRSPELKRRDVSSLCEGLVGATSLQRPALENIAQKLGIRRLVTAYGLTESSGPISYCLHTEAGYKVQAHTEVRVVNEEIHLRGPTVFAGYWDHHESGLLPDGWLPTGSRAKLSTRARVPLRTEVKKYLHDEKASGADWGAREVLKILLHAVNNNFFELASGKKAAQGLWHFTLGGIRHCHISPVVTRTPQVYARLRYGSCTKDFLHKRRDRGVLTEEGRLQILGRFKDLVIKGGVNISPEEIELALAEHESVLEASVVGVPDERLGEELCAWVNSLKVPRYIEFVDDLPRTSVGKVSKPEIRSAMTRKLGERRSTA
ncbi:hypothetical protein HPB48_010928 [Haemaphysalis longicornis]|uniref:Acyl-CoA synthetase n=1 Tax=Haemaphysalis longicornis TaxID=44386 RepID=A0A9J6GVK7_HAELO|nr:hypothetical protein HPB48_010928 [Haemaphysalis longicornis]